MVFVKKKDGGLRFCIDYRALNKLTRKNKWPLPRIDDLLDQAGRARTFSALDLANGYYQIRLSEEDIPKTAFNTPWAHYELTMLVMGLTNAPATFQKQMNTIFPELIALGVVLVWFGLDYILILSRDDASPLDAIRNTLEVLRKHGLQAKLPKCAFWKPRIHYLGHVLSADGLQPDPDKLKVVHEWQYPNDMVGLQQFLGIVNYFRRFIPNLSRLAVPLYHLTKKRVPFSKGEVYQRSFEQTKELLVNPPLLAYPDPKKPFLVVFDASVTRCGALLTQDQRPIAYFSAMFSPAEMNYTTTEQEMLGLVKALKHWRCYLEGCKGLTLVTDHHPLTYFPTQPTLSRRQARWNEFLSRFQFEVKHIPGLLNPAIACLD